jgi:hypothetical protein
MDNRPTPPPSHQPPSPADSDKSQFILTKDRRPPLHGSGSRSIPDVDSGQRTDRYVIPHADCPGFNGDNIIEWLRRCQSHFDMHQVPDNLKTQLATI